MAPVLAEVAVAVVAVVAAVVAQIAGDAAAGGVFAATNVLLCAATITAIVRRFLTRFNISGRILAAALSIYLLIGLLFTYV